MTRWGNWKGSWVSKLDAYSHHSGSFSKFQSPGWTLTQDLQRFEVFLFIQKLLRWFSKAQPILFSSVQWLSHVQLFAAPWTAARQASLSITNSRSLLKLMSIESWCHPTISSSVVPFSSRPQSFPTSGSFQMSQSFASGGQIIGVSASASVLSMNIQDWFLLGWAGWISNVENHLY